MRIVAETGSTNADLLEAARAGAPEGLWLRAERQTGGRGRMARAWLSMPGNLHASTIVRPLTQDPPPPTLALVAGLAVFEAARLWARDVPLALKWPNDLMAGAAKLAGILLERTDDAVVIGIGVNLAHVPDVGDRPTASLAALTGAAPDVDAFAEALAEAFARWLLRWRGQGLDPIRRAWSDAAHPRGTALAIGGREGLFEGLAEDGALRLRRPDGAIDHIHAGDVFLV